MSMSNEGLLTALQVAFFELTQARQNSLVFELELLQLEYEYTSGKLEPRRLNPNPFLLPTLEKLDVARHDLANSRVALSHAERQWVAIVNNVREVSNGLPEPVLPVSGGLTASGPVFVQNERRPRRERGRRSFKRER